MEEYNAAATEVTTGANEQAVAEPAESAAVEGGKAQEVTVPAGSNGSQTEPMSTEERHQQAQTRRIEEQRKREAEVNKRIQEGIDKYIADQKRVNPKTGQLITTQAEYDEVQAEARKRKREESLKRAGIEPEIIEGMINEHPDVKQARKAQQEAEAAKAHYDKLAKQEAAREELRKIGKIDPNIRTSEDLMAHPKYAEIRRLVQENNHTISEAFDIATKDDRDAQVQARAQTSAAAVKGSKAHMISSAGAGTGGGEIVAVPAEVAAMYRKDNPRLTDDQIRAKYGRYQKHNKKKG